MAENTKQLAFGNAKAIDEALGKVAGIEQKVGNIADDFSTSSTYAVDDVVYHSNKLYKCTTAVTTAGAWNAGNWTEVTEKIAVSMAKADAIYDDYIATQNLM